MDSPERTIQRARELGRVAHECALVSKARIDEGALDRLDAAVHHVARRDAVRACFCVVHRDLRDAFDGWLSVDRTIGV